MKSLSFVFSNGNEYNEVFNSVSRTSIEDVEVLGVRLTVVEQIKIVEIIADNLEAFELSEAVTFHGEKEADISEALELSEAVTDDGENKETCALCIGSTQHLCRKCATPMCQLFSLPGPNSDNEMHKVMQ